MLASEVETRVKSTLSFVEDKLDKIDSEIKEGDKDSAVYWLFTVYENITEAIQDIKDNRKDFQQITKIRSSDPISGLKAGVFRLLALIANFRD